MSSALRTMLRGRILRSGLSQSEAARRARISPQHLCDYLRGRREMRTVTLDRVLQACSRSRRRRVS